MEHSSFFVLVYDKLIYTYTSQIWFYGYAPLNNIMSDEIT